jgi:hypothetical protein
MGIIAHNWSPKKRKNRSGHLSFNFPLVYSDVSLVAVQKRAEVDIYVSGSPPHFKYRSCNRSKADVKRLTDRPE